MSTRTIELTVSLSDAELKSYSRINDELIVDIFLWNETILKIHFYEVISILDKDIGYIDDFCKMEQESAFQKEALERLYESEIQDNHGYAHFQFLNIDGDATLEIIAKEKIDIIYSN